MADPVVEAIGVSKSYEGVTALDGVSFTVGSGEVFALVGPNGAGKTTLMRLLTDILRPDGGQVRLFGNSRIRASLSRVGYMPEERGLYRGLTALDTVSYFARLKGLSAADARRGAERALEAVGMAGHAKRKLEELSKGMSQRVQFAATLAHGPDLLILDEPFSGLDPVSSRRLQELVQERHEAGTTVLLSTHNMEHAERLCQRLLMLHRGQVRLYGSIAEIKARYVDHALLVECDGPVPGIAGVRHEALGPHAARLYPQDGARRRDVLAALLAAGADVRRFEPEEPTLEDIFVRVAGTEGERDLRETMAAAV
ncbi:MAG: ATP-binding cassette domain-containing protein [Chthonomonadales bacterium]|nr:ATP-binding cassette domain-containing protein [Chthonomonadales bacterium]